MRTVGILGGMGPEATLLLMRKLIDAVPAGDDADHLPLIVDQNPQVPSRIRFLIENRGDDPGPVLVRMAARLAAAGAEALAMPCNTAHHFAPAIRAAVQVPLLDMVALSVRKACVLAGRGARIGLLASPAVRKVGLFDAPLARAGLVPVHPEEEASLLSAIRRIKAGETVAARAALRAASEDLLRRGAKVQIVACSEFSLVAAAVAEEAEAFDTLDVLAAAIAEFARGAGAPGRQAVS